MLEPEHLADGFKDEEIEGKLLDGIVEGALKTDYHQIVLDVVMGELVAYCLSIAFD